MTRKRDRVRGPGHRVEATTQSQSAVAAVHAQHSPAKEHSIWPVVLATGTLLIGIGLLAWTPLAVLGAGVIVAAIVGWLWEPWESA